MRLFASLCVCVVIACLSIACSSSHADSPTTQKRLRPVALNSASGPLRSTWRIGAPVGHDRLTIYPVLSDESADTSDLITLDEGLRAGTVTITELGADGSPNLVYRDTLGR